MHKSATETPNSKLNEIESPLGDPIFVLCNGRSGSTLLRFLLDAHPDLACPPETNLPALCAQLATVWSLIEGAPLSSNRGDEPPEIPDTAISGIRDTMDRMTRSYLLRRGKKRYCDKSLNTARFTDLLLRVYPNAKFICLYRHPMDVIASGLEACPFGLNGYGFDQYIATTPGNAVVALARFWVDNVTETLAAEERFPDQCIRIRYEDLVADPEGTAARIFEFVGFDVIPGISSTCFSTERERSGPGDYKIWHTDKVIADSVGRGWTIPAGLIWPPVLTSMNDLASKLAYVPVDENWGTSEPPADLRSAPGNGTDSAETEPTEPAQLPVARPSGPTHSAALGARLRERLQCLSAEMAARWEPHSRESLVAVSIPEGPGHDTEYWFVDLENRSILFSTRDAQKISTWDVVGSTSAWEQVMNGRLNLSVAFRSYQLRYCDGDESAGPVEADNRVAVLAYLLGLPN